ncbi:MAG: hypothetical protein ACOY0T_23200 [Myxococcota bacterium]
MHYVIGSGPSGVAAAKALLDAGEQVTLLDAGQQCEPERLQAARRLAEIGPERWLPSDLSSIRPAQVDRSRIPIKLSYGSSFPYGLEEMERLDQVGTKCFLSLARGGLSNVWGAAVLPTLQRDIADWPFDLSALTPHYARIAEIMPLAADHDDLEEQFPFYRAPSQSLRPSMLAAKLLRRMSARRKQLAASGVTFGKSRLAVRAQASASSPGCQYTGLCLSGCPYFAIWSTVDVLEQWRTKSAFRYRGGVMIDRVESLAGGSKVRLIGNEGASAAPLELEADRVFLACGPVSTARIVFDSLRLYGTPASLQFQPYFLLPLLAMRGAPGVERERLHTLAQLFIELFDPAVSAYTVHLQVYTFNEFIASRVAHFTGWLGRFQGMVGKPFLERLFVIQGYLHSKEGGTIEVRARPDERGGRAGLQLISHQREHTRRAVRRVAYKLTRLARDLGAVALPPLIEMGAPGDGNHIGGLFPHSASPRQLETDLLGQLPLLPRVHIVDSSVLPSLGATTFTYTTMANANRIASMIATGER